MDKLRGTGVALVTPFTPTPERAVDYAALRRLVDFTIEGGVEYLVINGTTAESATLTTEEKAEVLRVVREQVAGRVPLVYGIGGNDTAATVRTIQNTDLTGIVALLSASPYYNKPSQRGIVAHYQQLADASPVPVLLYNVPGRTSSNLTAATTLTLAQHPNIIGIKEASGNLEQCIAIAAAKPADFLLISGDDMMTTSLISFGAVGIISVLANAFPRRFSDMTRHALRGDFKAASELLFGFVELNPLMYEESNPVGVKAALAAQGLCADAVRLPLVEGSESLKQRIEELV
ncbi:4-hydroxy-tetrahydrodipicolinate synthase [Hymenobacter luteus]|uniref:4-hydroxy-tetrahydrodipicolinate synthase n=2 Tax=Hymenobacter TaxID=89966 RepID=A0A7W9WD91_9BACT|nr:MULTISPECIES: 4-hydroxy-tetrahydrodipicolinate synthase [Hymenobacter]MBB4602134.1 4-hydroxy-tetrahydrodipicolinate synthase [Hymenobacter latericoloratus]MBB6059437.1 4-hydroxy-tetrahydrodipicolinate synthase [Hymenobacter luteus]